MMKSFRDAAKTLQSIPDVVYLETKEFPILFERLLKHFPFREFKAIDHQILFIRSVKSTYELNLVKQAGKIHRQVLKNLVRGFSGKE